MAMSRQFYVTYKKSHSTFPLVMKNYGRYRVATIATMTTEKRQQQSERETTLTNDETRERNSLLKRMEENGDFDR
jgi:hypothetical protein